MENKQTPVFINLLAIARYDQMPDYPIQFMTTGKLYYKNAGDGSSTSRRLCHYLSIVTGLAYLPSLPLLRHHRLHRCR